MLSFSDQEAAADAVRSQLFNFTGPKTPKRSPPPSVFTKGLYEEQNCRHGACTRVAGLYADVCDTHAQGVYGCQVKESSVPSAGNGLFSLVTFECGDVVDLYEGKRLSKSNDILPYGFWLAEHNCVVDAASSQSCISRYVNHHLSKANCSFVRFKPRDDLTLVALVTTRLISPGEEFLVNYGHEYNNVCFDQSQHSLFIHR